MEEGRLLTHLGAVINIFRTPIIAVRDILPPRIPKPSEPQPPREPTPEDKEEVERLITVIADQAEGEGNATLSISLAHYRLGAYRLASVYLMEFVKILMEKRARWEFSLSAHTQLTTYLEELRRLTED